MMGLIKTLLCVGLLAGCTPPPRPADTVPEGAGASSEEEWCRPPNYIVPCVEDEAEECCAAVEMYGYSSDPE
jgi:hypothetical protein